MSGAAKVGVLGASGYTGAECVRLLMRHPHVEIALLTADRKAGQQMRDVFPQFSPFALPKLVPLEGLDWPALGPRCRVLRAAPRDHPKGSLQVLRSAPRTQGRRSVG